MSELPPPDAVIVQMAWRMTDTPSGRCPASLLHGSFITTKGMMGVLWKTAQIYMTWSKLKPSYLYNERLYTWKDGIYIETGTSLVWQYAAVHLFIIHKDVGLTRTVPSIYPHVFMDDIWIPLTRISTDSSCISDESTRAKSRLNYSHQKSSDGDIRIVLIHSFSTDVF